ncbi:hypothetical protein SAY86_001375 [Trapa natans]|uniref:Uncharacterized protein n=1 Tax=Trapa natans TaxID=22666 RepID=A0AAN7MDH9_TRANT|nr:hypothetical protein SAY86_001375 [Trapa natans]
MLDCHIPPVSKTGEITKHYVALDDCSAKFACNSRDVLEKDKIRHHVSVVGTSATEVSPVDGYNSIPEMEVVENCDARNLEGGYSHKLLVYLPEKKIELVQMLKLRVIKPH